MKTWVIVPILISGSAALAGPQFTSKCEIASKVRTPSTNQGFFMSDDCKTAFVLPPSRGVQTVTGLTSGNLERCGEVRSLNKTLNVINKAVTAAIKGKANDAELTKLLEQRKKVLTEYGDLADTLGASVELNFDMAIEKNLSEFRNLNRNLGVNFTPVLLKDMKLAWNQTVEQDPEMRIAFNQDVPVADANDIGSGSFSARLDLSLFGACPLRDPFTNEMPRRVRVDELAGIITPNVTYKYEVGATYTYVATFNRGALAKKIRSSSSSGGFFNTSTASSLIETAESSGWFSLKMNCEDSRVCDKAKIETALQIKQRLMQEVLDNISLAKFGFPVLTPDAGAPGKNGASTAADGLRKCAHPYCQAGAIVLDIASATLGGSSKTDTYISTNNHDDFEKVEMTTPVSFTGTMGFAK